MQNIRVYKTDDECDWFECYTDSYTHSHYIDSLNEARPRYETKALELVYTVSDKIVGIVDVQIEDTASHICLNPELKSGLISVLGVKKNYRRQKIATQLIKEAEYLARTEMNVTRFEVWIRDLFDLVKFFTELGYNVMENQEYYEIHYSEDFFTVFSIELPFNIYPSSFIGTVDSDDFNKIIRVFPPEKSYRIIILEKIF